MKPLFAELAVVLSAQAALYEQLLALSAEERDALSGRKPDRVVEVVRRKETLLLQVKTLDESRRLICTRIAADWKVPASTLTVSEIVGRLGKTADAANLATARERLMSCVTRLREANDANSRISQSGIEVIRRIVGGMTPAGPTTSRGNNPWAAYGVAARNPAVTASPRH